MNDNIGTIHLINLGKTWLAHPVVYLTYSVIEMKRG